MNDNKSLKPLANLVNLEELHINNMLPTKEYAMLSVKLKNTQCDNFMPYIKLKPPFDPDGNDIMIVGKRKPFLNSEKDAKRIEKYVQEFEKLKKEYL